MALICKGIPNKMNSECMFESAVFSQMHAFLPLSLRLIHINMWEPLSVLLVVIGVIQSLEMSLTSCLCCLCSHTHTEGHV